MTVLLLMTVVSVTAKRIQAPEMYLIGFSASFQDSTIYITDIQSLKGAWIDTKTRFLLGRDQYSAQLQEYCTSKLQRPNRVCVVFYATTKKDAEKKMEKLKKKYVLKAGKSYFVQHLKEEDFRFVPVDMSPQEE